MVMRSAPKQCVEDPVIKSYFYLPFGFFQPINVVGYWWAWSTQIERWNHQKLKLHCRSGLLSVLESLFG